MRAVGEYFSGVGADAVVAVPVTTEDTSWKKPWFAGLFIGAIVGYSIAAIRKK